VTGITIANNRIWNMVRGMVVAENSGLIDIRDNFIEGIDSIQTGARRSFGIVIQNIMHKSHAEREITLRGNYLLKFEVGISIINTSSITVNRNFISYSGYGVAQRDCDYSCIQDNIFQEISTDAVYSINGGRNRIRGNRITGVVDVGIRLEDESDPEISGNHLYSCGIGMRLSGLQGAVTLLNNRLINCGNPSDGREKGYSVDISCKRAAIRIDGCEIINTNFVVNGSALGIAIVTDTENGLTALQVTNNRIDYDYGNNNDEVSVTAFYFSGSLAPAINVLINSNLFRGPVRKIGEGTALVHFQDEINKRMNLTMTFSNNNCDQLTQADRSRVATVILSCEGMSFTVMGNQILSPNLKKDSLLLNGLSAVCVGNILATNIVARNLTRGMIPKVDLYSFNLLR
jgi:parallel beta-helix repeat protein